MDIERYILQPKTMQTTKILIADDHQLVAESLAMMLETESAFEIVSIVNNGWQALSFLESNDVDILLADFHMPLLNGKELSLKAREQSPDTKSIILTMSEEAEHIRECLQVGIYGYVMKGADKPELIKAIKTVANGERYFSENIVHKLAEIPEPNNPMGKTEIRDVSVLTKRELEILQLITQDMSNIEMADHLNLSPATVETHRRNLMKKLGISTAIGLMRWGLKNGVVSEEDII